MIEKKDFVAIFQRSIDESNLFQEFEVKYLNTGEVMFFTEYNDVLKTVSIRFKLSDVGYAPTSIEHWVRFNSLERLIQPIALSNGLNHSIDIQHTLAGSILNKELYKTITAGKLNLSEFEKSLTRYLSEEINPFFSKHGNIESLGISIHDIGFEELVNIGIGGEYPINILKAIVIAKWSGNLTKYHEYTKGLQIWIDEDRDNPNYAEICDSYQNALDALKKELENIT